MSQKGNPLFSWTSFYMEFVDKTHPISTHHAQKNFSHQTFHSNNLYQVYTHVKSKDRSQTGHVSGVLLYAKTDEDLGPNNEFSMGSNRIGVMTLDLNTDFNDIKYQLHHLVERFLMA